MKAVKSTSKAVKAKEEISLFIVLATVFRVRTCPGRAAKNHAVRQVANNSPYCKKKNVLKEKSSGGHQAKIKSNIHNSNRDRLRI
jgi:hypothetical protein